MTISAWKCTCCLQHDLPYSTVDDRNLLLSLAGLDESPDLNLTLLPYFTVRSLIDKLPGQPVTFKDLHFNKNISGYHDIDEFLERSFDTTSTFGVFHLNIASLTKHYEELSVLMKLLKYPFKIIGISETRLTKDMNESMNLELEEYFSIDTRTLTNAGGTRLYVHNSLKNDVKVRHDLSSNIENGFESIFVEIVQNRRKSIICGCIYKHPSLSYEAFSEECLMKILPQLAREDKLVTIMGDFNINLLDYDACTGSMNFYDMAASHNLQPLIYQPSRVTPRSQTLIDNIFTNNIKYNTISGNLTCSISDHFAQFAVFTDYNLKTKRTKERPVYGRSFKLFHDNEFLEELSTIEWSLLFENEKDPNVLITTLIDKITEILNVMAPIRKLSKKDQLLKQKPWITRPILQSMHTRDRLLKQCMKEKDQHKKVETHSKYKTLRNSIVNMIRKSKIEYFKEYFLKHRSNLRKTWDGIKSIIKLNKANKSISTFIKDQNNNIALNPLNIANAFNNYFATVGKALADKIPNSQKSFRSYMPPMTSQSLYLNPTDPHEINNIIQSLNSFSACGPHSIPTNLLKLGSHLLSAPISNIINQSFTLGVYPDILKTAKVVPIYKSGPTEACDNYRPISLLSNLSKVLEKTVYTRLYSYLERFNLIYDFQFGFRKSHSTTHALVSFTTSVSDALDRGEYACGLFLDLQKAFDTVNLKILLEKLTIYGIRGICLNWFESYVSGRKQFVAIDNADSEIKDIESGVPQGSVLGPLLFLIYINDFHRCISSGTAQHFADDTTILYKGRSLNEIKSTMSREISNVFDWLCANRLSLNEKKTEVVLFRPRRKRCLTRITLKVKSKTIFLSNKVKYLGVIFDSHLSWRHHIAELAKKLTKANGLLSKIRHFVDENTIKSLYHSLFHAHMTYGCLTWGLAGATEINRISNLQKQAIRLITFSDFHEHTSLLFSQLGILKLKDVIKQNVSLFMHDWCNHKLPNVFEDFFSFHSSAVATRSSTFSMLSLPTRHTEKYGSFNIKYKGAINYNQLCALNIKTNSAKLTFKKTITGLLLASYA